MIFAALRASDLKLAFVPVIPRVVHSDRIFNVHFFDIESRMTFQRLNDDVAFSRRLLGVCQMLKLTAAALVVDRAWRRDTVFRRLADFFDACF